MGTGRLTILIDRLGRLLGEVKEAVGGKYGGASARA